IELSTRYRGTQFHMLGYFKDDGYKNKTFQEVIRLIKGRRIKSVKKLLKNINARCILVGLESVSKGASVSLGRKPVDKREFARFIGDISDVGPVMISVMLGIPTETGKDFRSTVEYVTSLVEKYGRDRIIGIRVFWTVVTPGSRLSYESKKYKIRYALRGMPYVLSSEMFSRKDMIDSFEYIQKHKFSDMFIWEDSDPGRYYAEIKDFSILPEYREKYDKKKAIDIRQLIPGCRIGAGFYNKWKLISIGYEHEYPLLKFRHQSDNGMIILKVLYKITDSPFKTKKYSVSVCNTVDPEYDEDLKSICNKLISEISKNE
ncbi:MAG: hypothetical protein N3B13_07110, partial [Deltaproteobacteria bacterium]|nr:hypothetical protein [Deltaproteobacteria bacterium]